MNPQQPKQPRQLPALLTDTIPAAQQQWLVDTCTAKLIADSQSIARRYDVLSIDELVVRWRPYAEQLLREMSLLCATRNCYPDELVPTDIQFVLPLDILNAMRVAINSLQEGDAIITSLKEQLKHLQEQLAATGEGVDKVKH